MIGTKLAFNEYLLHCTNDETCNKDSSVKVHWDTLLDNLETIGFPELNARQADLNWYLSENGVTYNVYNDPKGQNRPWNLNTVPTLINADEWEIIEKGIQQRAELFNLILKDLYGERELIKNGIIPQEVIYSHRGFIRACDRISYCTNKQLLIYGADIARGPDGRMWVYSDRTQAPSGMGYALENRLTVGRVLPDLSKGLNVRKISAFFQHFNQMLIHASPRKSADMPNIVVLTPGPLNETYFEHAYLASFMGYPLVQGNDLVARDGYLWMKSLKGLKQVDVVLRRLDDMYADPLELREDSRLGVPGLLEVVRKGNVSIINPVGSRVLENPGLIPFIPGIANYFLGEKLILPQVASWWCGQEKERNYVLDHLSELIVRRIDQRDDSVFVGYEMARGDLKELRNQIKDRPYRFVAQECIGFSTTPTFVGKHMEPRKMAIRTFGVATFSGYEIMPGGLVRVSPAIDGSEVTNQTGGLSKDLWVVDDKAVERQVQFPLSISTQSTGKGLEDLPSLTAENLFWAGRYVGRALSTARFLRMVLKQMNYTSFSERKPNHQSLEVLFRAVTNLTCTYPGFLGEEEIENPFDEIYSVILDNTRMGSLAQTMSMFFNTYYSIRNIWSSDMWRVFERINTIWTGIENEQKITTRRLIQVLDQLITRLIAIMGLVEESILIEQGLLLYFIGLQMELGMQNISKCRSLLAVKYPGHVEYEILESLLNSHESLNIYRHSYRSFIKLENVIDLIILDQKYPRSLAYRFNRLNKDLAVLPKSTTSHELASYEKLIFEGFAKLRLTNSKELAQTAENSTIREKLDALLAHLSDLLYKTSTAVTTTYFSHSYQQNQLVNQKL